MDDVGRYRLLRSLGRGGMAEVFEAIAFGEGGFQRRVALKRLLPGHETDPSFARMFLDEARIASSLHHANIVAILDYGIADGMPFQILEFVDGLDLRRVVRRASEIGRPLSPELVLHVCTDIAHALEHAHAACDVEGNSLGIVHRDVSPSNILVSWSADVKLADFGIAFAKHRSERTSAGVAKGKLTYMAPEQLLQGEIDGRTDIFALGCVLYRLMTGKSPLSGVDAMPNLMSGGELELDPSLPEDLRRIVARATRRKQRERFSDAAAMASALGRTLGRRIDQDPRTLMRQWLAPLRPETPRPSKRGRLDDLVNVEIALDQARSDGRHFRTMSVPATPVPRLSGARTLQDKPLVGPATTPVLPRPRHARNVLLAVAALAAGGLVVWNLSGETEVVYNPISFPASVPSEPATADDPIPTGLTEVDTAAPSGSAKALAAGRAPGKHRTRKPSKKKGTHTAEPKTARTAGVAKSAVVAPAAAGHASGSGVVVIGGAGAHRASILVDGVRHGFSPKTLELPLGEHKLELVTPDGRRIGPTILKVSTRHTRSAPLRWIVPASP